MFQSVRKEWNKISDLIGPYYSTEMHGQQTHCEHGRWREDNENRSFWHARKPPPNSSVWWTDSRPTLYACTAGSYRRCKATRSAQARIQPDKTFALAIKGKAGKGKTKIVRTFCFVFFINKNTSFSFHRRWKKERPGRRVKEEEKQSLCIISWRQLIPSATGKRDSRKNFASLNPNLSAMISQFLVH